VKAPYPFTIGKDSVLSTITFGVKTDAAMNWNQTMLLKGFDADICPFI
jgi:hypothetical protein